MCISRYYGIPKNFCRLQSNVLRKTIFTIRTALGESSDTYTHTNDTPIHGTGQGSCASPAIWLLLSSFLMTLLQKQANGMTMRDVDDTEAILIQWIEGFVDDTSIFTNSEFSDPLITTLEHRLKEDGCTWAGLLEASGGRLEYDKCFYYLLSWKWDKKGKAFPTTSNEQQPQVFGINLGNQDSDSEQLKQKDVDESHKTLGAFKPLFGNENDQIKYLQEKSDQLAVRAKQGQLNRRQARRAYSSYYIPAMIYSMASSNLNKTQLQDIQRRATTYFLQICGYEGNFPRAVVYGPIQFGGLGMKELYTECNCNRIESLLCHINMHTQLGQIMKMNLNWLQINYGTSIPTLRDFHCKKYIQHNWFTNIQQFLASNNATIDIAGLWTPKKMRAHDIVLMDQLMEYNVSEPIKIIFNNWRLYYQVNTLSDMTNCYGDRIQEKFLKRNHILSYTSDSTLRWPNQEPPDGQYYRIWIKYIQLVTNCDSTGRLVNKLGTWLRHHTTGERRYCHLLHASGRSIITTDGKNTECKQYHLESTSRSKGFFNKTSEQICSTPTLTEFHPIDVNICDKFFTINTRHTSTMVAKNESSDVYQEEITMHKFLKQVSDWSAPLFRNVMVCNEEKLMTSNTQLLKIGCDGSVRDGKAGYGILYSIDNETVLQNSDRLPETYNQFTSYRSEGYGMMSAIHIYIKIQQYAEKIKCTTLPKRMLIICDNQSIVNEINKLRNKRPTLKQMYAPDNDVISQILHGVAVIEKAHVHLTIQHIKGHQDRNATTKLSDDAVINIEADQLATDSLRMQKSSLIPFPTVKARLLINKKLVTSDYSKELRNSTHSILMRGYLQDKYKWNDTIIDIIWWSIHGKALAIFPVNERTMLNKFIHRRLPCNEREHMYNQKGEPFCKTCADVIECQNHIIRCSCCEQRVQARKKMIQELKMSMVNLGVHAATIAVIITGISDWINDTTMANVQEIVPNASESLKNAVMEQNTLGWDQFIRGRWSMKWAELFMYDIDHSQLIDKFTTADNWGKKIIGIIWRHILIIWKVRNDTEYGINSKDGTKEKLIHKISWYNDNMENKPNPYKMATSEQLQILPLENLLIMNEQLRDLWTIHKRHRKDPLYSGEEKNNNSRTDGPPGCQSEFACASLPLVDEMR
jgi:hypothetical protein